MDDPDEVADAFQGIVSGQPSRWTQLLTGVITVEDLDDEELVRGRTRDRNGKFSGSAPTNVPRAMHNEIQRRLQKRGLARMQATYFEAIDTVADIMRDSDIEGATRLNAAKYIIERIAGKTPDRVDISVEVKKYEQVFEGIKRLAPDAEGVFRVADKSTDELDERPVSDDGF